MLGRDSVAAQIIALVLLGIGVSIVSVWIVVGALPHVVTTRVSKSFIPEPDLLAVNIDQSAVVSTTTIVFGGDVMLARHVQVLQEQAGSYEAAWEQIRSVFSQADIAVINLESPLSDQPPFPTEGFVFKAKPDNLIALRAAGIDVAHLANNHFDNAGAYGMTYTIDALQEVGIQPVGVGTTTAAYAGHIVERAGVRIGFVGQGYDVPWNRATDTTTGIAVIDLEQLQHSIMQLREHGADIVVAMMHAGTEYTHESNQVQKDFAYTAIDAGADIVIGHHPHWIQEIEQYQGKYIFYSLGNLIFDQNWSAKTSQGLVVRVAVVDGHIAHIGLLPVVIEANYKPRFANSDEARTILEPVLSPAAMTAQ